MNDPDRSIGERDFAVYGGALAAIALLAIILSIVS